jgi:hypothetical protein
VFQLSLQYVRTLSHCSYNVRTNKCYKYNVSANMWKLTGYMNEPRYHSGFDSHPEWGLVLSGGEIFIYVQDWAKVCRFYYSAL